MIQLRQFWLHVLYPMRDLLGSFFATPIRILSRFIPKDEKRCVFGSWMGKQFSDNPKYFCDYLRKNHPEYRCIVVMNTQSSAQNLQNEGYEAYTKYSIQGLWQVARSRYLFVTHSANADINICTASRGQTLIHFWHGSPGKKLTTLGLLHSFHSVFLIQIYTWISHIASIASVQPKYIIAASKFGQKKLSDFFQIDIQKVPITGYPRNDILFQNAKQNNTMVFLYVPTYRSKEKENSPLLQYLDELELLMHQIDAYFIVKLHPAIENNIDLHEYSRVINFHDYYSHSITEEGMIDADVLITDYSGLLFDYALTGRPIIFFTYDFDTYSVHPGLSLNFKQKLPGPFVQNVDELFEKMSTVSQWRNSSVYKKKYEQFRRNFNTHIDNNSSERVFSLINTDH